MIGSINDTMGIAASALNVNSMEMLVSANNIANISTDKFTPQRALLADGPSGQGVAVDVVMRKNENGVRLPDTPVSLSFNEEVTPSKTDLATETVHMISAQRSFEANAKTIQTTDEMFDSLLNIKA